MKKGKSARVDNITAELVQAGGEDIISSVTAICNKDLADRRMASSVDPVLNHHSSQERQLAAVPELPNNQPHSID